MFHLTSHSTSYLALKPMVVLCRVDCICYQVLGHIGSNTFELSRVAKVDRSSTYSEEAASYKASSRQGVVQARRPFQVHLELTEAGRRGEAGG